MAFNEIPSSQLAVGQPITQALMTSIRDNIRYAAESAWHPYDMVYPGDGNTGLIYDFTVHGAVTTITSPVTLEDGFEYGFLIDNLKMSYSGDGSFSFQALGGGGWFTAAGIVNLTTPNGQTAIFGFVDYPFTRYVHTLTSPRQNIQGTTETNGLLASIRILTTSSTASGKVYMLRRREHLTLNSL